MSAVEHEVSPPIDFCCIYRSIELVLHTSRVALFPLLVADSRTSQSSLLNWRWHQVEEVLSGQTVRT